MSEAQRLVALDRIRTDLHNRLCLNVTIKAASAILDELHQDPRETSPSDLASVAFSLLVRHVLGIIYSEGRPILFAVHVPASDESASSA